MPGYYQPRWLLTEPRRLSPELEAEIRKACILLFEAMGAQQNDLLPDKYKSGNGRRGRLSNFGKLKY